MAWILEAKCDSCAWEQELLTNSDRRYRIPGGTLLPVYSQLAWCQACNRMVEAEELVSRKEIEAERKRTVREKPFDLECWRKARMEKLHAGSASYDPSQDKVRDGVLDLLHWPWEKVTREEYVAVLDAILSWRQYRHSAARCLECGSLEIQYLKQGDSDAEGWGTITHPACGGTISIDCTGHAQTFVSVDLFSSEGKAINPCPS